MTRYDANDELPRYGFSIRWSIDAPDTRDPWIGVSGGDLPCPIEVRLGKPKGGRVVCTGLRIGQWDPDEQREGGGRGEREVSSRLLRDIKLGSVLRALREHISGMSEDARLTLPLAPWGLSVGEMMGERVKTLSVRRGRKGLDPETLQRTAEVYLQAVAEGSTQPLAVAAVRLDVDASTVWRRLQNAYRRFPERFPELKPKKGGTP